jgi:hypothetical protein
MTFLNAEDYFDRLNPSLTKIMKINQQNAKVCKNPAVAKENFDANFRYGCFCGKGYPYIIHKSKKSYKKLNRREREELISQYYKIKPYDSIDELCMKHDICFIYEGREDQICNTAIYDGLRGLEEYFEKERRGKNPKRARRCQRLVSDISSIFGTVFGAGDNISPMKFGIFAMITTPMTVVSKGIQKSAKMLDDGSTYPLANEKCDIDE